MPIVDNKEITPEQAIAMDRCPETGLPLKDLDILAWVALKWPYPLQDIPEHAEARRRVKMLLDYHEKRQASAGLR
jgi:hypothetical protein